MDPLKIIILVILAVVLFGERLPEFARKAAKALHYVRNFAGKAQTQLKSELGPEFANLDFRDLNPKQFVKKHLLDEVEPIITDVRNDFRSVAPTKIFDNLKADLSLQQAAPAQPGATRTTTATARAVGWDREAT